MQENSSVTNWKRLSILLVFFALFLLIGIGALFTRMVLQSAELQDKAASQWTRVRSVSAARGDIVDRDGTVLAGSVTSYTVAVLPQEMIDAQKKENTRAAQEGRAPVNLKETTSQTLSGILGVDEDTILRRFSQEKKYEVWVKRLVSYETAMYIQSLDLPGVRLIEESKRFYPMNNLLCQVLGFTTVDGVGQEGIEGTMNKYLQGEDGFVKLETDVSGRELPESIEEYVDASPGATVKLTISAPIQGIAEKVMQQAYEEQQAEKVTAIVMDPRDFRILALVNKPDYNLNDVPRSDSAALSRLSRNTAVSDAYEVGSIFKILTLASALETGAVTPQSGFSCPGYHIVNGVRIKCWTQNPHGTQNLAEATANSCNPAFMQMGLAMGAEAFYEKLYAFGLGSKTGSLFSGEASGIVNDIKYVRDTDLARIAFGQSIAVTPLQMICAAAAAINGGTLMKPLIVDEVVREDGVILNRYEPETVRRVISEDTSATVRNILEEVVKNGSGRNGAVEGYRVGGKTGTAQKYDENGRVTSSSHVATFIGFAPVDDPEVIVLVVVDDPKVGTHYGSTAAAPYASQILEETLNYLNIEPDVPLSSSGEQVQLPDVVDLPLESAIMNLQALGLEVAVEGYGQFVASQVPDAGSYVQAGSRVMVCLENYEMMADNLVEVPELTGKTPEEALLELRKLGLNMKVEGEGTFAFAQDPPSGTSIERDGWVTVRFIVDTLPEDEEDDNEDNR